MTSLHTKEYKQLIAKLKTARTSAGLTQIEVAERLKKPQSYVSKIENGQRRLDVLELKQLAKLYKVRLDDLM